MHEKIACLSQKWNKSNKAITITVLVEFLFELILFEHIHFDLTEDGAVFTSGDGAVLTSGNEGRFDLGPFWPDTDKYSTRLYRSNRKLIEQ